MVRAVKNVADGGAFGLGFCPQVCVDFGNRFVGVFALGNAALVCDDDEFEAGAVPRFHRLQCGGQNAELSQALGVITRVVVDDPVSVEQNGGSREVRWCGLWHGSGNRRACRNAAGQL